MTDRFASWFLSLPAGSRWVGIVTVLQLVFMTFAPGPAVQLPLAVLFYLTCPGMILIDWLDLPDLPSRVAISTATSLSANILIVTLLLSTGLYAPATAQNVIAAVAITLALVTYLRTRDLLSRSAPITGPVIR